MTKDVVNELRKCVSRLDYDNFERIMIVYHPRNRLEEFKEIFAQLKLDEMYFGVEIPNLITEIDKNPLQIDAADKYYKNMSTNYVDSRIELAIQEIVSNIPQFVQEEPLAAKPSDVSSKDGAEQGIQDSLAHKKAQVMFRKVNGLLFNMMNGVRNVFSEYLVVCANLLKSGYNLEYIRVGVMKNVVTFVNHMIKKNYVVENKEFMHSSSILLDLAFRLAVKFGKKQKKNILNFRSLQGTFQDPLSVSQDLEDHDTKLQNVNKIDSASLRANILNDDAAALPSDTPSKTMTGGNELSLNSPCSLNSSNIHCSTSAFPSDVKNADQMDSIVAAAVEKHISNFSSVSYPSFDSDIFLTASLAVTQEVYSLLEITQNMITFSKIFPNKESSIKYFILLSRVYLQELDLKMYLNCIYRLVSLDRSFFVDYNSLKFFSEVSDYLKPSSLCFFEKMKILTATDCYFSIIKMKKEFINQEIKKSTQKNGVIDYQNSLNTLKSSFMDVFSNVIQTSNENLTEFQSKSDAIDLQIKLISDSIRKAVFNETQMYFLQTESKWIDKSVSLSDFSGLKYSDRNLQHLLFIFNNRKDDLNSNTSVKDGVISQKPFNSKIELSFEMMRFLKIFGFEFRILDLKNTTDFDLENSTHNFQAQVGLHGAKSYHATVYSIKSYYESRQKKSVEREKRRQEEFLAAQQASLIKSQEIKKAVVQPVKVQKPKVKKPLLLTDDTLRPLFVDLRHYTFAMNDILEKEIFLNEFKDICASFLNLVDKVQHSEIARFHEPESLDNVENEFTKNNFGFLLSILADNSADEFVSALLSVFALSESDNEEFVQTFEHFVSSQNSLKSTITNLMTKITKNSTSNGRLILHAFLLWSFTAPESQFKQKTASLFGFLPFGILNDIKEQYTNLQLIFKGACEQNNNESSAKILLAFVELPEYASFLTNYSTLIANILSMTQDQKESVLGAHSYSLSTHETLQVPEILQGIKFQSISDSFYDLRNEKFEYQRELEEQDLLEAAEIMEIYRPKIGSFLEELEEQITSLRSIRSGYGAHPEPFRNMSCGTFDRFSNSQRTDNSAMRGSTKEEVMKIGSNNKENYVNPNHGDEMPSSSCFARGSRFGEHSVDQSSSVRESGFVRGSSYSGPAHSQNEGFSRNNSEMAESEFSSQSGFVRGSAHKEFQSKDLTGTEIRNYSVPDHQSESGTFSRGSLYKEYSGPSNNRHTQKATPEESLNSETPFKRGSQHFGVVNTEEQSFKRESQYFGATNTEEQPFQRGSHHFEVVNTDKQPFQRGSQHFGVVNTDEQPFQRGSQHFGVVNSDEQPFQRGSHHKEPNRSDPPLSRENSATEGFVRGSMAKESINREPRNSDSEAKNFVRGSQHSNSTNRQNNNSFSAHLKSESKKNYSDRDFFSSEPSKKGSVSNDISYSNEQSGSINQISTRGSFESRSSNKEYNHFDRPAQNTNSINSESLLESSKFVRGSQMLEHTNEKQEINISSQRDDSDKNNEQKTFVRGSQWKDSMDKSRQTTPKQIQSSHHRINKENQNSFLRGSLSQNTNRKQETYNNSYTKNLTEKQALGIVRKGSSQSLNTDPSDSNSVDMRKVENSDAYTKPNIYRRDTHNSQMSENTSRPFKKGSIINLNQNREQQDRRNVGQKLHLINDIFDPDISHDSQKKLKSHNSQTKHKPHNQQGKTTILRKNSHSRTNDYQGIIHNSESSRSKQSTFSEIPKSYKKSTNDSSETKTNQIFARARDRASKNNNQNASIQSLKNKQTMNIFEMSNNERYEKNIHSKQDKKYSDLLDDIYKKKN